MQGPVALAAPGRCRLPPEPVTLSMESHLPALAGVSMFKSISLHTEEVSGSNPGLQVPSPALVKVGVGGNQSMCPFLSLPRSL